MTNDRARLERQADKLVRRKVARNERGIPERIVKELQRRRFPRGGLERVRVESLVRHLREYVTSWIEADFFPTKWPFLEQVLEDIGRHREILVVYGGATRPKAEWLVPPNPVPRDQLEPARPHEPEDNPEEEGRVEASHLMLQLILGPYYRNVGQCARKVCERFYFNASGQKSKKFCSSSCGRVQAAADGKRRKRDKDLWRAQEAIGALRTADPDFRHEHRRPRDWKRWVAGRAKVTPNFITSAIKRGELDPQDLPT